MHQLEGKSENFYETQKKVKVMERLDRSVPDMSRTSNRGTFQSIYKSEVAPDYYDSDKIVKAQNRLQHKKRNAFVDLGKQTKRDFSKMWQTNDNYKNVVRENQRAEYIKNLLAAK